MFILAIPEDLEVFNFINLIGEYFSSIRYIRFIYEYKNQDEYNKNTSNPRVMRALLYFIDQNSADNFYYVSNYYYMDFIWILYLYNFIGFLYGFI